MQQLRSVPKDGGFRWWGAWRDSCRSRRRQRTSWKVGPRNSLHGRESTIPNGLRLATAKGDRGADQKTGSARESYRGTWHIGPPQEHAATQANAETRRQRASRDSEACGLTEKVSCLTLETGASGIYPRSRREAHGTVTDQALDRVRPYTGSRNRVSMEAGVLTWWIGRSRGGAARCCVILW